MPSYQDGARHIVKRLANTIYNNRLKQPIAQLEYSYADGYKSALSYLNKMDGIKDEESLETAVDLLIKVDDPIYEKIKDVDKITLEQLLNLVSEMPKEYVEETTDTVAEETDSVAEETDTMAETTDGDFINDLKAILEIQYTKGIDELFDMDLNPPSLDNNYLWLENKKCFHGLFSDGGDLYEFKLQDLGNDEWDLNYLAVESTTENV